MVRRKNRAPSQSLPLCLMPNKISEREGGVNPPPRNLLFLWLRHLPLHGRDCLGFEARPWARGVTCRRGSGRPPWCRGGSAGRRRRTPGEASIQAPPPRHNRGVKPLPTHPLIDHPPPPGPHTKPYLTAPQGSTSEGGGYPPTQGRGSSPPQGGGVPRDSKVR